MTKHTRFLAFLLSVLLILPPFARCEDASIPIGLKNYCESGEEILTEVQLQFESLYPYGDETITQMNALLKHMSLAVAVKSEEDSAACLKVDGDDIVLLLDQNGNFSTSLLPNRVLQSKNGTFSALSEVLSQNALPFDAFAAFEESQNVYQKLAEEIRNNAEGKKASYSIKNIGKGKWSYVAKLTADAANELYPDMKEVLNCGLNDELRAVLDGLALKKNFSAALYQTAENGDDIALYLKGSASGADGKSHELSYQWAFTDKDGKRKDSYKLEYAKGLKGGFSINALITQKATSQAYLLDGKSTCKLTNQTDTLTYIQQYKLEGSVKSKGRTLKGTITFSCESKQEGTTQTVYQVDLLFSDIQMTGTVSVSDSNGSKELNAYTLSFKSSDMSISDFFANEEKSTQNMDFSVETESGKISLISSDSSLSQSEETPVSSEPSFLVGEHPETLTEYSAPSSIQVLSAEDMNAEDWKVLQGEMAQRMAGKLLIALSSLPIEDTAFLRDNLSEENYTAFLQLVSGL